MLNTMRTCQVWLIIGVIGAAMVLGGCGGGSEDAALPTGTVRLLLTDLPAGDISEMHVHIVRIEISNRAEATKILLQDDDLPDDIELLALADNPMLLGEFDLREGRYSEIRVLLSDQPGANWVRKADGSVQQLALAPIDPEGGTRLVEPFHVQAGATLTLLMDFNAAASIYPRLPGEPWGLRPMIFAQGLPGADPALGAIKGTVTERDGDPLQAPAGRILGVFVHNQAQELVGVAEVREGKTGFAFPQLSPGNYYLSVRFTTPTWDLTQTGDPLTLYTPGAGPTSLTVRAYDGAVSAPNLIIDL